jgi:hypothetical protein
VQFRTVVLPPEYVPRSQRTRVISNGDSGFWGGAIFGAALLAGGSCFYLWKRNPAALAKIAAHLANHLHSQATKNQPPVGQDAANNHPQGQLVPPISQPAPTESSAKPVPQRAAPQQEGPEWYVFRSGQAEGPYTKQQLWEIQKITERTKVRRGDAEWVKAGEVPELKAFLTQK